MADEILFTRHGETEDNVIKRLSTLPPGPSLTDLGRSQASTLASQLHQYELKAIYTSPLIRAKETAEILRGNKSLPIYEEDGFRELSVGAREGRTDEGVFEEMDEVWNSWTVAGNLHVEAGPNGETATQVIERGKKAVSKILTQHDSDGGSVLIVAHSGILQLLVPQLCNNLKANYGAINWLRNCQLIRVKVTNNSMSCISWGDVIL